MAQAEACLAPIKMVRMLASREAADRLATLRVESIMTETKKNEKDKTEIFCMWDWKRRGKNRSRRERI